MTKKELRELVTESIHSLVEKKLCPKGRAYYNRRIAAGESPSAYLSGRAVKVCKGLMEDDLDEADLDLSLLKNIAAGIKGELEKSSNNTSTNEVVLTSIALAASIPGIVNVISKITKSLLQKSGINLSKKESVLDYIIRVSEQIDDYLDLPINAALKPFISDDTKRKKISGSLKALALVSLGVAGGIDFSKTPQLMDIIKGIAPDIGEKLAKSYGPNVVKTVKDFAVNLLSEEINPLTWEPIIKAENEEIERTAEDLNLPYDVIYDAFVNGKEVTLNDDMWSRLENTDSYDIDSEEEAIELARQYGKDYQSILAAEKTPPALILQYSPNKFYLVGGNTRLMFARAKGINPQVILATIEPKNKWAYQDVTGTIDESLRDWFKKEDWVRIDTQGNITGDCGTMKKGKATTRCLPRAKANRLTKKERAATARKKAAEDRKGDRVVPNTKKAKVRFRK